MQVESVNFAQNVLKYVYLLEKRFMLIPVNHKLNIS